MSTFKTSIEQAMTAMVISKLTPAEASAPDPVEEAYATVVPQVLNAVGDSLDIDNMNKRVAGFATAVNIFLDLGFTEDSQEIKDLMVSYKITPPTVTP
jgi:hypothetical protein